MIIDKTKRASALSIAVLLLAACGPKSAPPARPAEAAAARPDAPEFAACDWQEAKGKAFSVWGFSCKAQGGTLHLEPNDAVQGFDLVAGTERRTVIRTFAKPASAPIDAALPAVRAASPGSAACVLEAATAEDAKGRYWLAPVGAAKAAWDKAQTEGAAIDPPCGPLGVAFVGDIYFWEMPGHPDTVVMADMGSEIQPFHPETLSKN